MSQDVAARLAALSQDHREGRLTVSAYRSLRAPLLDMLMTAESLVSTEAPVDSSTTTRPRHRVPTVGASVGTWAGAVDAGTAGSADAGAASVADVGAASAAGAHAAGAASSPRAASAATSEPHGLLTSGDSLVEASALARTNLQATAQAEEPSSRLWPLALGAVLLVMVVAGWMAWPLRESAAPPVAQTASPEQEESPSASVTPARTLTPMPPPLPSEPKRKSSATSPAGTATTAAAAAAAADAGTCEPQPRTTNASLAPCRDRLSPTEFGPRMLPLPGPATSGIVFAISARPVSQAQFRLFCQRTSRPYPRQPWTEDDDPVVNVTWNEAREYLAWLSSTTGKRYRLATETEWLYFMNQSKVDARWRTGNVREWLQDGVDASVDDAESREAEAVDVASTAPADSEHQRLVRGVSYADAATDLLSARRSRNASMRDAVTGFRALREIH